MGWGVRLRARVLAPGAVNTLAGMADQVLASLANLAIGLIVLRYGTKLEFGLYGLGYTAIVVANSIAGALFASPMTASYYHLAEARRGGFAGALFLAQAGISVPLAGLLLAAAMAAGGAGFGGAPESLGWALVIVAAPAAMLHDRIRGYRFLRHQGVLALGLDALNAALWIGFVLLGVSRGVPAHAAALGGYGLACLVTGVLGLVGAGLARVDARAALATLRETWALSRWALGGVAVGTVGTQAHLYLLAWLASVEAVAEVNAARMLIAPVGMLVIGLDRGLVPLLARQHAEGRPQAMRRLARAVLAFVLALLVGYLAAVFLFWDLLVGLLLRGAYQHIGALVVAWGAVVGIQALVLVQTAVLQAQGRFRSLTLMNLVTAVPMLACAVPLIAFHGGLGGLAALGVGQVVLSLLLWRDARRRNGGEGADSGPLSQGCASRRERDR